MKEAKPINMELLRETYRYDRGWLVDIRPTILHSRTRKPCPNPKYNHRVGSKEQSGYIVVFLGGSRFKAHRLIWALRYGDPGPRWEIDHRDGVRDRNVYANLRRVPSRLNARNNLLSSRNSTGFKGVSRDGKRYKATICVNRKLINLGRYNTPEAAAEAYKKASIKLHGEYGNPTGDNQGVN